MRETLNPEPVPRLPPQIELGELVGEGRRSRVFRARLDDRSVALKVYRQRYAIRHRHRHDQSLARFEHDRNAAFYAVRALRPYVVEPLTVIGENDGYTDSFVQEFFEGQALREIVADTGSVPAETLDAVRYIIDRAQLAGLHDIDLDPDNMRVRRTSRGWIPVLFDFNMVPQHMRAPNPFVALLYLTGLRDRSYRDRRWLRVLEQMRG